MQLMIEYARAEGLSCVHGQVLQENTTMLGMCRQLGFAIVSDPQEHAINVATLRLKP
jgi:acetyltransferase